MFLSPYGVDCLVNLDPLPSDSFKALKASHVISLLGIFVIVNSIPHSLFSWSSCGSSLFSPLSQGEILLLAFSLYNLLIPRDKCWMMFTCGSVSRTESCTIETGWVEFAIIQPAVLSFPHFLHDNLDLLLVEHRFTSTLVSLQYRLCKYYSLVFRFYK